MKGKWLAILGVGILVIGLATQVQAANFGFDVELQSGQSSANMGAGQVFSFNVYANVLAAGADAATSGFNQGIFGLATAGALKGTLTFTLAPGLHANGQSGTSDGTQRDLDADGDIDIGGTDGNINNSGWIWANNGSTAIAGLHVLVGSGTFTATGDPTNLTSALQVVLATKTIGSLASKNYDFFQLNGASLTGMPGNSTNLTLGSPIAITGVPEPMTMAVLAMGGLGLLLRRRTQR